MRVPLDNAAKERRSRYPNSGQLFHGRDLSVIRINGGAAAVNLIEQRGHTALLYVAVHNGTHISKRIRTEGHAHSPVLAGDTRNGLAVIWVETLAGVWRIRSARLDVHGRIRRAAETLHESPTLISQPAAAFFDGHLHVAWSGIDGDAIRIHWLSSANGHRWPATPVSGAGLNAFRPTLCASGDRLLLAWDEYRDNTYAVALASAASGKTPVQTATLAGAGEKWCFPRLAANANGTAFMTWYVEHVVTDDRGLTDHAAFAMAARIVDGTAHILHDDSRTGDCRIIADMREGLLASRLYKGYLGHRRRPMAAVSDSGDCWLLWEVRPEESKTGITGHLAARCHQGGGQWTAPAFIADGGYAYGTAVTFADGALPLTTLVYTNEDAKILAVTLTNPATGTPYTIDPQRWAHWHKNSVTPMHKPRRMIEHQGQRFRMHWADTHVHSHFSADAEGEVDELIHFARDRAGLDALAITDNDVYPHKPLFRAEWEMHRELCRFFTQPGAFVLFHGYEFTFHDPALRPDFNHRIVLHPGLAGELLRRIDPGTHDLAGLYRRLKKSGALCYPHHCSYALINPAFEWNIEVCSSWRVCLQESDFSMRQLQAGARFGFIGSSDTHRMVPGMGGALTGIYAETLAPEALFDAYRRRRIVASQGFPIFIAFSVNDLFIGEEGEASAPPVIRAEVEADDPIETVEVVRDGQAIHVVSVNGAQVAEVAFTDDEAGEGEHVYFLRIRLVGDSAYNFDPADNALAPFSNEGRYPHNLAKARGVWAWTSPVWMRLRG